MILTQEEGDQMVQELLGLDRAETTPGYDHLCQNWEGGTELGPQYDENVVV